MKVLLVLTLSFLGFLVEADSTKIRAAEFCNDTVCSLPDCRCATDEIPGNLNAEDVPQFLIISLEGPLTESIAHVYRQALFNRRNPDKCPVKAYFTTNSLFTNFSLVHEVHARGMDIGIPSTSIAHDSSVSAFTEEYMTQRKILAEKAEIPETDINCIAHRFPRPNINRKNIYAMMGANNFSCDFSPHDFQCAEGRKWPFTLEYITIMCTVSPTFESYPGLWVIPDVRWSGMYGDICTTLDACILNPAEDVEGKADWLIEEFNKVLSSNRAPLPMRINTSWFWNDENNFFAFLKFLEYIYYRMPHVFLASPKQVVEWTSYPRTISEMIANPKC